MYSTADHMAEPIKLYDQGAMEDTLTQRLAPDIRLIVYRYIFDDAYRQVVSQYKQKAGTHNAFSGPATYVNDTRNNHIYFNWRVPRQPNVYIYNLKSDVVAKLPKNY